MIDLDTTIAAIYSRIATESAGSAARSLLTGGVYPAAQVLRTDSGKSLQLPTSPFALFRAGAISGQSGDLRGITATWWIYDQRGNTRRLAQIVEAIEAAYRPRFAIAFGQTQVGPISAEFDDSQFNLLGRSITITYTRGS